MARVLSWRKLEARAEATLALLERSGVAEDVRGSVLDLLLEEPASEGNGNGRKGARQPKPSTWEKWLDRIERRLNDCEHFLAVYHWSHFARLLEVVLPERYLDQPPPERATQTPPGTPARVAVMSGRQLKGKALRHPGDPAELPDDLAVLWPSSGNGVLRPVVVDGEEAPTPRLVVLQGQKRDDLPELERRVRTSRVRVVRCVRGTGDGHRKLSVLDLLDVSTAK